MLQFPTQPPPPENETTSQQPTVVATEPPYCEKQPPLSPTGEQQQPTLTPEQQAENRKAKMRSINETELIACVNILVAINGNAEDVKNANNNTEILKLMRKYGARAVLLKRGVNTLRQTDALRRMMAMSAPLTPPAPEAAPTPAKE